MIHSAHSTHTHKSSRLPTSGRLPPFMQQSRNNNYPRPNSDSSFFQSALQDDRRPGNFDYDYNPESSDKPTGCFVSQVYEQSIPTGDVKSLPSLEFLKVGTTSRDACGAACCALGPSKCQYLWLVRGKCLAVACTERDKDKCMPSNLSGSSSTLVSFYLKMEFGDNSGKNYWCILLMRCHSHVHIASRCSFDPEPVLSLSMFHAKN